MLKTALGIGAGLALAINAQATTLHVCPVAAEGCDFTDIQAAVDAASDGDRLLIRKGAYRPTAFRDSPHEDVILRGFVHIEKRRLTIEGEAGAVLDGEGGIPSSAFVLRDADVAISGLAIRNFGMIEAQDDIYDGHGIFQVGGRSRLSDLDISGVYKMALVVREDGRAEATRIQIRENGVATWIDETARLKLTDSVVSANTAAGMAVYADTRISLDRVTFAHHEEDALFIDGRAQVTVRNSRFDHNRPYVFHLDNQGRVRVSGSVFCNNAAVINRDEAVISRNGNKEC